MHIRLITHNLVLVLVCIVLGLEHLDLIISTAICLQYIICSSSM